MAKKIKKISIVDQVAEEIKKSILSGVWSEGDKIPTEAEFAETFGVNRLSVRMALQKLNTLGMIETRVGEGSYIKRISLGGVFNELADFYDNEKDLVDIMQLRFLLESDSIRKAVKCATEEEKEELGRFFDEFYRCWKDYAMHVDDNKRLDETVKADYDFHLHIIKMSHNQLYVELYLMIRHLLMRHMKQQLEKNAHGLKRGGATIPYENETHNKIYQAIMSADEDESLVDSLCSKMVGISTIDELMEM